MTPDEAREAIDGKHSVSVFFAGEVWARRLRNATSSGGHPSLSLLLPSELGVTWELVGDPELLPPGRYDIPMFNGRQQALVVRALAKVAEVALPGPGFQLGILIELNGVRYLLHQSISLAAPTPSRKFPESATLDVVKEPPLPPKKIVEQGERILVALRTLGFDPQSLPLQRGEGGPKRRAWIEVSGDRRLFPSEKTFDKAWEHLRSAGEIQDATPPRSRR